MKCKAISFFFFFSFAVVVVLRKGEQDRYQEVFPVCANRWRVGINHIHEITLSKYLNHMHHFQEDFYKAFSFNSGKINLIEVDAHGSYFSGCLLAVHNTFLFVKFWLGSILQSIPWQVRIWETGRAASPKRERRSREKNGATQLSASCTIKDIC